MMYEWYGALTMHEDELMEMKILMVKYERERNEQLGISK